MAAEPDNAPSFEAFAACTRASETYHGGDPGRRAYIDASLPRLWRIVRNLALSGVPVRGPTLDVASGWGILFPALRRFVPDAMPYEIAELGGDGIRYDGVTIPLAKFEVEKDRLPHEDRSFGLVMFCDCLEHLVVDPLWPLIEFNRVLRTGGHLVVATPNALGAFRIIDILSGRNPATEHEIKPSAIYQRHNREYTPKEVCAALEGIGFEIRGVATNDFLLTEDERRFLGFAQRPPADHGPELFVIAEKVSHVTLDLELDLEARWPAWLYTGFAAYRRRPAVFPIVVGDDYA